VLGLTVLLLLLLLLLLLPTTGVQQPVLLCVLQQLPAHHLHLLLALLALVLQSSWNV
jgi:hypothetical protein